MKIICEHLSKEFISNNKSLTVLSDINAEICEREFICILGSNGCGKTTLLRIMAGILPPSGGRVYCAGHNGHIPASLIFQEQGLFPWLNVIDNACFYLEMKGMPRSERYAKVSCYIEKMGLTKFINYYPYQLSAGMKQKVNLIRGLVVDSPFLLIDEPDTSLDIATKSMIHDDVRRIWKEYNKTIIYVTHDVHEALRSGTRIWIMSKAPATILKDIKLPVDKVSNVELYDLIVSLINE
ncbi:ATP-binding cassette domain-containing protein [bacterium]|nr:MAG: ATP-binding cassette domain-containing protein [bacterium]